MSRIAFLFSMSMLMFVFGIKAQTTPDTLYMANFDSASHVWIGELFSYSPCAGWGSDHHVVENPLVNDLNPSDSVVKFPHCFPGGIGYVTSDTARLEDYNSISFKAYSGSAGYVYAQWFRVKREDLGEEDDIKLQQTNYWVEGGKWNEFTDNFHIPLSDTNTYKVILLPDYRTTDSGDSVYFDDLSLMKTFEPKSLDIAFGQKLIDGTFDDWNNDKKESLDITTSGIPAESDADFLVSIKSAWDKENLYLYGEMLDDVIIDTVGDSWKNDGFEIAFNMAGNDQFHAFWDELDPPDNSKIVVTKAITEVTSIGGAYSNDDLSIVRSDIDGGWAFEMSIPLDKLYADFDPSSGTSFNLGVQANDNDDGLEIARKVRWSSNGHINKTVPNSTVNLTFAQKQYSAMFNTVLIDGDLSEWNDSEGVSAQIVNKGYNPVDEGDFETSMKIAWDMNNLYLYGEMIDQTNNDDYPLADMWKGDNFEITLNMAGDDQFNAFWDASTPPDNSKVIVSKSQIDTIGVVKGGNVTIERTDIDGGWAFEMAIPFSDLYDNFEITNGTEFNFDYQAADTDTAERESRLQWASDQNINKTIPNSIVKLSGMPIVTADGIANEDEPWDTISALPVENFIDVENITDDNDFKAEAKVFWTDTYLSMFITVQDDSIFTGAEEVYNGDNIELYLDMNNSKLVKLPRDAGWSQRPWDQNDNNDFQIRFVPGSTEISLSGEDADIIDNISKTALVGYNETENGYTFEFNMKFDNLAAGCDNFESVAGTQIGFDLNISDNDNDPDARDQVAWNSKTAWVWNDPSLWGTIELVENNKVAVVLDQERPQIASLEAEVTDNVTEVQLKWTRASDNVVADNYIIYQDNDSLTTLQYDTSYVVSDLDYETEYTFGVEAVDYSGNKSAKKTVKVTTGEDNTAVNDLSIKKLAVYPNPATNKIYLNKAFNGEVKIYSTTGTLLKNRFLNGENSIDISALAQGVYLIILQTDEQILRTNFIKN